MTTVVLILAMFAAQFLVAIPTIAIVAGAIVVVGAELRVDGS